MPQQYFCYIIMSAMEGFLLSGIPLYNLKCMCIFHSLSNNNISDEGARAVADGMKYCTSLQSLQ